MRGSEEVKRAQTALLIRITNTLHSAQQAKLAQIREKREELPGRSAHDSHAATRQKAMGPAVAESIAFPVIAPRMATA